MVSKAPTEYFIVDPEFHSAPLEVMMAVFAVF